MPTPSTISISYDGSDITDSVIFIDASWESQATAVPGTFSIRIKDMDRSRSFTTGREIKFTVDGVTLFGGYLTQVGRTYAFPVVDTEPISEVDQRIWELKGADYNILFDKRVFYNKADPLNHPSTFPVDSIDQDLIIQMCEDYLDLPGDLDFTSLVDAVDSPNRAEDAAPGTNGDGAWVPVGSYWRDQMNDFSKRTGALYYINGDKQLVNKSVEDSEARWGFSDVPNNRGFSTGNQQFQGVTIGPRELDILEDGSNIVNDALVWGGSMTAGVFDQGSVVFGRAQNAESIAAHHRWQFAELHPNDQNYLSEQQVQKRANLTVNGISGTEANGLSRGLQRPNWTISLTWFGHDVPQLGGTPDHLKPGDLVTFIFYALGTTGAPFVKTLPLRNISVSFPTLDSFSGDPYLIFRGSFSLSPTDPWSLWHYLIANRNRLQFAVKTNATTGTVTQGGLSPAPNGTNTVFHITGNIPYVLGSTSVVVNSLAQRRGIDYTESDPAIGEVTFTSAPRSGDTLWIYYQSR